MTKTLETVIGTWYFVASFPTYILCRTKNIYANISLKRKHKLIYLHQYLYCNIFPNSRGLRYIRSQAWLNGLGLARFLMRDRLFPNSRCLCCSALALARQICLAARDAPLTESERQATNTETLGTREDKTKHEKYK